MISKIKFEYLLGLIAVFWALFFSYVLQLKPGFSPFGDDGSYLFSTRLLYFNLKLDDTRPLLISAIHGIPYLFGFTDDIVIKWGIFINFLCWFFTSILIFKIISNRFDRKKAFLFSIIFISCIGNLAHVFNFLSESIFIFMIVFSIYLLDRYYKTKKHFFLTLAISILLLNVLVKPISIGLVVIVFIFFIKNMDEIIINRFSFFLVISVSLIVFQMYSLKKNYGDYTISYISSITYYNYLGAKADCYRKNIEYIPGKNDRTRKMMKLSDHQIKELANNDFKEQLKNNTNNLIKAYFYCIYSNSYKGNFIISKCKNVKKTNYFNIFYTLFKAVSKLQNIIFTITGVLLSFYFLSSYKKNNKFYQIISIFILYIFFISAISCFQCDRFHIVFFPLLLILFGSLKYKKSDS